MYPAIQNLRAFVAVVEAGQFRIAAERVGVSESAVSHQIARLEAQLDVQLLERDRNGVAMTETGRAFYAHVSSGLKEISLGLDAVKRDRGTVVTITAPQTLSSLWLAPNLTSFYEANPAVEIRVLATDRVCDLSAEGIDFALRRSDGNRGTCNQEHFCSEDIYPVANNTLKARIDEVGWNKALEDIPVILNETHGDEWEKWCSAAEISLPAHTRFRRLGSYDQVQAAAIHGLGIAMARTPLCIEALSDGRLHRIGQQSCRTHDYQLVWPSDRRMRAPQHALLDWMRATKPEVA